MTLWQIDKIIKDNIKHSVLKAPIDNRLGNLSGKHMNLYGLQSLATWAWTDENAQGGFKKFLGDLTYPENNRWNEITTKFTNTMMQYGYTILGSQCSVYSKLPFIYCFNFGTDNYDYIFGDSWAESVDALVKEKAFKFENNPLCIGVFLGNEVFWGLREYDLTEQDFLDVHTRFVDITVGAIKKYAPHWLIFSNKYCRGLSDPEQTWDWMTQSIAKNIMIYNIEKGVDVICINWYLDVSSPEIQAKYLGKTLRVYEEYLSTLTNKEVTVLLSETGIQANSYERTLSSGLSDLWWRYTSKQYPQTINQISRADIMKLIISSVIDNGGLGYFMHAACDHGPEISWKKHNQYMNWGIYEPWRDILYTDFLEIIKNAHTEANNKRKEMGLDIWDSTNQV